MRRTKAIRLCYNLIDTVHGIKSLKSIRGQVYLICITTTNGTPKNKKQYDNEELN
jgi:hypothetical protein